MKPLNFLLLKIMNTPSDAINQIAKKYEAMMDCDPTAIQTLLQELFNNEPEVGNRIERYAEQLNTYGKD